MSLTDIQKRLCWEDRKRRADSASHLLTALRGHLSEQRVEEAGVLEQNTAQDSQVGGHNNGIPLYNKHNINAQPHMQLQHRFYIK